MRETAGRRGAVISAVYQGEVLVIKDIYIFDIYSIFI